MRTAARKRVAPTIMSDAGLGATDPPAKLSPGSITTTMVTEAEVFCRSQRLALAKMLRVDEAKIGPGDRKLVDRVMETISGDGIGYEKAMAHQPVNEFFARGVLRFAR